VKKREKPVKMNLIKEVCGTQGLTYRELGEKIGYSEETLKNCASTGKISEPMLRSIELYNENIGLKEELSLFDEFKSFMKKIL